MDSNEVTVLADTVTLLPHRIVFQRPPNSKSRSMLGFKRVTPGLIFFIFFSLIPTLLTRQHNNSAIHQFINPP